MKFLADEDFPKPLVDKIRNLGFSVRTVQQKNLQGSSDKVVAQIGLKERRILLTFDKDFLINKHKSLKVIIFRFPKTPTSGIIHLLDEFPKDLSKLNTKNEFRFIFNKDGLKMI